MPFVLLMKFLHKSVAFVAVARLFFSGDTKNHIFPAKMSPPSRCRQRTTATTRIPPIFNLSSSSLSPFQYRFFRRKRTIFCNKKSQICPSRFKNSFLETSCSAFSPLHTTSSTFLKLLCKFLWFILLFKRSHSTVLLRSRRCLLLLYNFQRVRVL